MRNVFVDTNVLFDFLIDRPPFSGVAADILELAVQGKTKVFVAAISINNIYYTLRKIIGHKEAKHKLKQLSSFIEILDVTHGIIEKALDLDYPDFEDGIQYLVAISNPDIEAIITRDIIGFKNSKLPVLKPDEALKLIN